MDFAVIGGDSEAVRRGVLDSLYGFRSVQCSPYLGAGVKGLIVPYNTFGIASRVVAPAVDGYVATFTAVDESSGLACSARIYEDLIRGRMVEGMSLLFGAKCLQPEGAPGIIKLV